MSDAIRINNLVMRVVSDQMGKAKVEVADVITERRDNGQRTTTTGEWRDPSDEEREAFEALVWD